MPRTRLYQPNFVLKIKKDETVRRNGKNRHRSQFSLVTHCLQTHGEVLLGYVMGC